MTWTCDNCGYSHWDEKEPISCIICNNDKFVDAPEKFYQKNKKEQEK